MKRNFLVLCTTVLLGGSLGLVGLLTREAPPAADAPAQPTAEAPAVPDPEPLAAPMAPRAPPWAASAARQPSASQSWKPQVRDPSAKARADRGTRKVVRKALLAAPVEEELARCVDRDREVWFGGSWASPEPIPQARPAILMLDLETVGRQVKIAEVRVKSWGEVSRAAVACARDALVGTVVDAAKSKPAGSMQMTFLLSPRSGAVATAR